MFDSGNHIFQLAVQFVNQTGKSIFLTGKAGSGKTTFLKYIRETGIKKMTVLAPTGVAAINAGGVTMHSFFQLPFGPYLPTDQYTLLKNVRFNAEKRNLLQELELLVMDEISMVRADTMDAIDALLRHFRGQPSLPFGGVQVLYIGDLFQLPPVVPDNEWEILKAYYKSPFFFDAKVLEEAPPLYLELQKIYRQSDTGFIDILNNIRYNRATTGDLEQLHEHYVPGFEAPRSENYITLTSHNAKAIDINETELNSLEGVEHPFEAVLTGEFNEKSYPADKTLRLKEGAQIMFIKNDKGEIRRYYNGKIGTIKTIGADKIIVTFPGESGELEVEQEIWKNIRYNYNPEKDNIEEEELGTFKQYPIRLAWAITIHKSQGLTFEKAIIDAGASFAAGQVYVALSRLTSMNDLVLRSRIHSHSIVTDQRVIAFTERRLTEDSLARELENEQQKFIGRSLILSFNWSKLVEVLQTNYDEHDHRSFPEQRKAVLLGKQWLDAATAYNETAVKFSRQLGQLLAAANGDAAQGGSAQGSPALEQRYTPLQQRTEAAATYFIKALQNEFIVPLREHIEEFRVKTKVKKYIKTLREMELVFTRKKEQIEQAARIAAGLTKGTDASTLLSILQEGKQATPEEAKAPKGGSQRISLDLFLEGNSVADIAERRSMSPTTIETHLAAFIITGELDVTAFVPEHKVAAIRAAIEDIGGTALTPFKERLGDEYTFGEIKAVIGHLGYIRSMESTS